MNEPSHTPERATVSPETSTPSGPDSRRGYFLFNSDTLAELRQDETEMRRLCGVDSN